MRRVYGFQRQNSKSRTKYKETESPWTSQQLPLKQEDSGAKLLKFWVKIISNLEFYTQPG